MDLSRRDFLKGTVAGAAGVALTGLLGGCSTQEVKDTPAAVSPQPDPTGSPAVPAEGTRTVLLGDILNPQEDFTACTTDYSHIFSPLKIGGVTLKNRMAKSAAGSEMQKSTDWPDPTNLAYYRQLAKGGVAMICTEASNAIPSSAPEGIDPALGGIGPDMGSMGLPDMGGAALPGMDGSGLPDLGGAGGMGDGSGGIAGFLTFTSDEGIPAHKAIADVIHEEGALVIAQLLDVMGSGAASTFKESTTFESTLGGGRMQSTEEVQQEIRNFIDAAERYQKAGFDGVELNASCNHYFSTFLSRRVNIERNDQYSGASIENRCRILTEIISGIRERLGNDFVIQVLYSGVESDVAELGKDQGCTTLEEAVEFAKLFEKAGASSLHIRSEAYGHHCGGFMPDIFHVPEHGHTGYGTVIDYGKHMSPVIGKYDGVAGLLDVAAEIKKNVTIPVGTVGSMDPRLAPDLLDNAIADGKIDFFLMTRPLMADFDMPNKLREGRRDEVAPCTHCMTCFVATLDWGVPMYCRVNPALSRALTNDMPEGYDPVPTETPKNVMVIGGGPAGMEAARIAAQRGHHVKLYEKSDALGGRLDTLQKLKGTHERILDHKNYLIRQLEVYGVEVVTGREVTADLVKQEGPDTVVVAVGSQPGAWDDQTQVTGNIPNMTDMLAELEKGDTLPLGDHVVLVGAQFQACEIAVNLMKLGKTVTMLNPGPEKEFYMNGAAWPREMTKTWLRNKGLKLYHNAAVKRVSEKEVTFETEYGVELTIACDCVVQALPERNDRRLYEEIGAVCDDVYAVGNCYSPGTIANATARANLVARKIGEASTAQTGPTGDNIFTATATGIGDVTVTITVEDGKLTQVKVDTSNETAGIGRELGEQFAQQILEKGAVDTVSGATVTSNAVREALAQCMKQAGLG